MDTIPLIGLVMIFFGIVLPFAFKREDDTNPISVGCISMTLIFLGILVGAPILESMLSIVNMTIVYGGIVMAIIFITMRLFKK